MFEKPTPSAPPGLRRRRRIYTFDGRPEKVTVGAILVSAFFLLVVMVPVFTLFAMRFGE